MFSLCRARGLSVLLAVLFFLFGIGSQTVLANPDLVVEGKVVGYELHEVKLFNYCGALYPQLILVQITKLVRGKEGSEFILVSFPNLTRTYVKDNFGIDKTYTLKLIRSIRFDSLGEQLFHPGWMIEDGEMVKTNQTLALVPGVQKVFLPLERLFPGYVIMPGS